ncbi:hypothetical protein [Streptomyces sp. NPDC102462]|uniref:hypothetical protein n=1 Tax=Streptomyces sp. NPDC102462 TaxID=3366178 RepID=UPI00380F8E0E
MHQQNRKAALRQWRIAPTCVFFGHGSAKAPGPSDTYHCHVERETHQPRRGPACLDTHAAYR